MILGFAVLSITYCTMAGSSTGLILSIGVVVGWVVHASGLSAACAPGGVVLGYRASPGGDKFSNEGCEHRCQMHSFSKVASDQFSKDQNKAFTISDAEVEQAINESDFVVLSGWQGFKTNLFRYPPGSASANRGKVAPAGKILLSRHMDSRHLAGKMLFENAPYINITMVCRCGPWVFLSMFGVTSGADSHYVHDTKPHVPKWSAPWVIHPSVSS
jgi:hypothetical protein